MKIIAFHYAGGNKHSYKNIQKHIPDSIQWVTLELPGRGARFKEELVTDIGSMAADLFEALKTHVHGEPFMFYGHSMGTLLAYEMAKKLREQKMELPVSMFFTGRGAPSLKMDKYRSELPKDVFWKEVHDIGGLPLEVLQNKELLDLYYPILKADFKAIEEYKYMPLEQALPIPLHICMGTEEIGQGKKVSLVQLKEWDKEVLCPAKYNVLEGDHFFILKHPKAMAQNLVFAFEKGMMVLRN